MREELLPCPFCGSKSHIREEGATHIITCAGFGCYTSMRVISEDRQQAISKWNTRPDSKTTKLPATGPLTENMILEKIAEDERRENDSKPYKWETFADLCRGIYIPLVLIEDGLIEKVFSAARERKEG